MVINPQTLRGIYVAFNTIFNKALTEVQPMYTEIASVIPSTTDSETYAWLGDIPGMREWIGDREVQNLTASDYTIKNKDFELTVGVDRNAIEDDKLGIYNVRIEMLAQSAATHPDELIFKLLADGFTTKCFDGQPFFSAAHKIGEKTVSNMSHAKLSMDAYIAARTAIKLIVPPALEKEARDILVADFVNGTKNTMQGTAKPVVVPQLAGHDSSWFLLCTNRPVKPLIYQQRKKAKFVSKTQETDENVFMKKQFLYGADSRGNAGFGFWQMAFGSDGTGAAG